MDVIYGRSFTWGYNHLSVNGQTSAEESTQRLAYFMVGSGYRLPKWYEVYRWFENRPAPDLRAAIEIELELEGVQQYRFEMSATNNIICKGLLCLYAVGMGFAIAAWGI